MKIGKYLGPSVTTPGYYQDPTARASDIQNKSGAIKSKTGAASIAANNAALANQGSTGIMGFSYE